MKQILSLAATLTAFWLSVTVRVAGLPAVTTGAAMMVVSFGIDPRLSRLITDAPFTIIVSGGSAFIPAGRLNESVVLLDAAVVVIVAPGYKMSLPSAGHKFAPDEAFCAMKESDIFSKSNPSLSNASPSVPPNVLETVPVEVHLLAAFKLLKRLLKR